ncbi:hypothetical protein V2E25_01540 [Mycoplasmopsis arginini]|uniref:Uncharacterized protein n=1 Tax=Mycoplasmopsis arginini TaxID=2094 RepID=A0ABZ2AMX9_MYCAR|nr:hypothetical protein [Mycoplasmopsis arginini]WVN22257.1 hypothetical protein V2E25_01540 [Mycoplasmopsis arginini]VEU81665.1 Uncharacterised protein [Mycoplasmopsis arginini]
MLGRILKTKQEIYKIFPISRNNNFSPIESWNSKTSRPFVVFYTNDKVYYLSVKSLTKENEKQTLLDKNNLILPQGIYDDDHPSVINCGSINIMDRALFEKIYNVKHYKNNYFLEKEIYCQVINKLNNNLDNLVYHEVDHIDFENNKTIWKAGDFHKEHRNIMEFIIPESLRILKDDDIWISTASNDQFYTFINNKLKHATKINNIQLPKINHNSIYYSFWEEYKNDNKAISDINNFGEFLEIAESDPNTFLYLKPEDKQPTDEDTQKFRM